MQKVVLYILKAEYASSTESKNLYLQTVQRRQWESWKVVTLIHFILILATRNWIFKQTVASQPFKTKGVTKFQREIERGQSVLGMVPHGQPPLTAAAQRASAVLPSVLSHNHLQKDSTTEWISISLENLVIIQLSFCYWPRLYALSINDKNVHSYEYVQCILILQNETCLNIVQLNKYATWCVCQQSLNKNIKIITFLTLKAIVFRLDLDLGGDKSRTEKHTGTMFRGEYWYRVCYLGVYTYCK